LSIQDLVDRYYHTAYDKIWADSKLSVEQKLAATERAYEKACARIYRETGYRVNH
jgi:hypothetical protein